MERDTSFNTTCDDDISAWPPKIVTGTEIRERAPKDGLYSKSY